MYFFYFGDIKKHTKIGVVYSSTLTDNNYTEKSEDRNILWKKFSFPMRTWT